MKNNIRVISILSILFAISSMCVSIYSILSINRVQQSTYHGFYCYIVKTKSKLFATELIYCPAIQRSYTNGSDIFYFTDIGESETMVVKGRYYLDSGWYWLSIRHIGNRNILIEYCKNLFEAVTE